MVQRVLDKLIYLYLLTRTHIKEIFHQSQSKKKIHEATLIVYFFILLLLLLSSTGYVKYTKIHEYKLYKNTR